MKQDILTSKITLKLYNKNKAMEKSPLNKQLTYSMPQILTLAIQLLYLKSTLEYIYWHQPTEIQQFLHIKVNRQKYIIAYRKGMLEVKRSKQKRCRLRTIGTWCSCCNEVFRPIAECMPVIKCPACIQLMYYRNYVTLNLRN